MTNGPEENQSLPQDLPESVANDFAELAPEERAVALEEKLQEFRQEAEHQRDLAQRAQAELINYRKRSDDERLSLQQYSNSRLLIKMLPVVDELELAVSHAGNGVPSDSWLEGVKLIQRKVVNLLESEGVTRIDSVGTQFNPLHHEAVGTAESDEYPSGFVVEVVRNGYLLHDRVIQAAQVVVAR